MEYFNMNDIYMIMNTTLTQRDYANKDLESRKELINEALIEYFSFKLSQLHLKEFPSIDGNSIFEVFKLIYDNLDNVNKFEILSQVIHYILSLLSLNQSYEVIWEIDDTLGNEEIVFVGYNKLDEIKTSSTANMVIIFESVYKYYLDNGNKKKDNKEYNLINSKIIEKQ